MSYTSKCTVRFVCYCVVLVLTSRMGLAAQNSSAHRVRGAASAPNSLHGGAAPSTPQRPAAGNYRVLYSFAGHSDGAVPGPLTALKGALYGTTQFGGPNLGGYGGNKGNGIVFKIDTAGNESVLHAFGSGSDGSVPSSALIDVNGELYGTTGYGGSHQAFISGYYYGGTVFAIDSTGKEHVVYSFPGSRGDAATPLGSLKYANGILYGASSSGGVNTSIGPIGDGALFRVSLLGAERVIYSFGTSPSDGIQPNDPVDVNGMGYGTCYYGGAYGFGTLYEFDKAGERVVYQFKGGSDGAYPNSGLVFANGVFYGTTYNGGGNIFGNGLVERNFGTVFAFNGSAEHVLYSFHGYDGALPNGDLIFVNGALYGTTNYQSFSAGSGYGTIFKITASGTETTLHFFGYDSNTGLSSPADGINPRAGLIYVDGALYGTTQGGGSHGFGAVFKLKL